MIQECSYFSLNKPENEIYYVTITVTFALNLCQSSLIFVAPTIIGAREHCFHLTNHRLLLTVKKNQLGTKWSHKCSFRQKI